MNRVYRYGCLAPTENAQLVHDQMRAAHRYRNQLVEIERARRAALREPSADREKINAFAADLRRGARALTPAYWGTYLLIESADDQARKASADPRFQRWEGDSAVGVQIQGGINAIELGGDTRVQLTTPNEKRHAVLRLRVGSDGRAPIWAEWPILLHRELPADAVIKYVTVHMRRRGRKTVWSAEFSLVLPSPTRICGEGLVAVDLGWRMIDSDMRVCTYASEDGSDEGDLRLTEHVLGGFDRVHSLRSLRDDKLNECRAALREYRASPEASAWFAEESLHVHAWRAPGRFVRLLRETREQNQDPKAVEILANWKYRDTHLWDWETGQNGKNIHTRKKLYEEFGKTLATKYETLVLEEFDLRTFARRPDKDVPRDEAGRRESHQEEKARAQRHEAATSELRAILTSAFESRGGKVVKVPAHNTTRTCSDCGLVVDRDFAESIHWTCDCGVTHDQDVNASDNLCARYRTLEKAGSSTGAKGGTKRESKWARLKREKLEKDTAREAASSGGE